MSKNKGPTDFSARSINNMNNMKMYENIGDKDGITKLMSPRGWKKTQEGWSLEIFVRKSYKKDFVSELWSAKEEGYV